MAKKIPVLIEIDFFGDQLIIGSSFLAFVSICFFISEWAHMSDGLLWFLYI